ncbi:hypothetical protein ALC60_03425 [Trachymyrmex zeteki]|uniref:Uncharacterized protein n=1 Tax=Mycetomoellerius zeteki TaxID=64791 RepID=A0A151XAU1_9HYME|nr:hypothetical protein ALC60_03425 [Trachymyrmex zeteki]
MLRAAGNLYVVIDPPFTVPVCIIFSTATKSDSPAVDVGFDDFSEKRSSSKTITLLRPRSTSYIGFIRDYRKKNRRSSAVVINPGYFALHNVIFSSFSREHFQAFAQPKRSSRYSLPSRVNRKFISAPSHAWREISSSSTRAVPRRAPCRDAARLHASKEDRAERREIRRARKRAEREVNARTRRCEEGLEIKGIKGIRSETKGYNAVSVNCDARIKETVTPGEKESRKREEREGPQTVWGQEVWKEAQRRSRGGARRTRTLTQHKGRVLRIAARIVGPARGHTGPYIAGLMGLTGPRRHSGRRYTGRRGPRLDNNHIHRETHNANRKDAAYYAGMSTEGSRGSSRRRAYLPFSANDLCMCVCVKGSEFISSTLFELPSNRETLAALSRSFNAAGTPKSIHIDESLPCHTLRAHAILINSLEHRQELVVDFLFMRYLIITNEW